MKFSQPPVFIIVLCLLTTAYLPPASAETQNHVQEISGGEEPVYNPPEKDAEIRRREGGDIGCAAKSQPVLVRKLCFPHPEARKKTVSALRTDR